jgi:hypothetical protein
MFCLAEGEVALFEELSGFVVVAVVIIIIIIIMIIIFIFLS